MADNKKIYTISINGIDQSIKQVDALSNTLNALDQKIKAMESRTVNVSSAGNSSTLSQDTANQKEINKLKNEEVALNAKIAASQTEVYKSVQATKDLYKEAINDQKQLAAQERLTADAYSNNTMQGMKDKLADLKTMINTTDLGDSEKIQKFTKEANELTNKLKEMEQAYGQFGRNVGNYASAAEGFGKIQVAVGNTVREYNNYREALKSLKQERFELNNTLGRESEEYKNVDLALRQLESTYKDLEASSGFMDKALDTMKSITAIASVSKGLSAFFGIDNDEIQQSIQKLVALQNALQGIETISKQLKTNEFLGGIFTKANASIDKFCASLFKTNQQMVVAKTNTAAVAAGNTAVATSARAATFATKALSLALKSIGIGLIIAGVVMLIEAVKKLADEMDDASKKARLLEERYNTLTKSFDDRLEELSSKFMSGAISAEDYLINKLKMENELVLEQIRLLKDRAKVDNEPNFWQKSGLWDDYSNTGFTGDKFQAKTYRISSWKENALTVGLKPFPIVNELSTIAAEQLKIHKTIESLQELEEEYKKCQEVIEGKKTPAEAFGMLYGLKMTLEDVQKLMDALAVDDLSNFIGSFEEVEQQLEKGEISADEYNKKIEELYKQMNNSEVLRSVLANLDKYIPDEEIRGKIENIISTIRSLYRVIGSKTVEEARYWRQVEIDTMEDGAEKRKAQLQLDMDTEIQIHAKSEEDKEKIRKKYQRKELEEQKKHNKKIASSAKKQVKTLKEIEIEIYAMRIKAMKEGFAKTMLELEIEKNRRIEEAKKTGKLVQEQIEVIEQDYNNRVLDARRSHHDRMLEEERNFYKELNEIQNQAAEEYVQNQSTFNALELDKYIENYPKNRQYNKKEYSDVLIYDYNRQFEEESFKDRLYARLKYYNAVNEATKDYNDKQLELERQRINLETQTQQEAEEERFKQLNENLIANYKEKDNAYTEFLNLYNNMTVQKQQENKTLLDELRKEAEKAWVDYWDNLERLKKAHEDVMKEITKSGENGIIEAENNYRKESQNATTEYYANMEDEVGKIIQSISAKISNSVKTDKWGFINYSSAKKELDELEKAFEIVFDEIKYQKRELDDAFQAGDISTEQYDKLTESLYALEQQYVDSVNSLKNRQDDLLGDLIQGINRYFQEAMQGVQTIMDAFSDYEDYQFDKEQKTLDNLNEMLSKKLQKQEDIIAEHSANVNSIENDLATARGDRRDHLIDQLNAEIEAQRNAEKERRNIEKQQEQAEKDQEKLDKKRQEAEYKRNLNSILVSTAMATANGLATKPFVPVGIAMGALATTLGMVQYALAKKQKPYGEGGQLDGGVAQGASHRDGGIPVLGGKASIEGGEFITNRTTTSKNVELLEYINSKKKRINIDDMLEFYSDGRGAKRAITTVRTKFADGGVIPTLRTDIDINDRLIQSFEDYSNRPQVVSVVEIIDKMSSVREVQTMAGIQPKY